MEREDNDLVELGTVTADTIAVEAMRMAASARIARAGAARPGPPSPSGTRKQSPTVAPAPTSAVATLPPVRLSTKT